MGINVAFDVDVTMDAVEVGCETDATLRFGVEIFVAVAMLTSVNVAFNAFDVVAIGSSFMFA